MSWVWVVPLAEVMLEAISVEQGAKLQERLSLPEALPDWRVAKHIAEVLPLVL